MNKKTLFAGLAAGVGILGVQQAQALTLNWASVGNAQLVFNGKTGAAAANFTFAHSTTTGAGFDFQINGSTLGANPNTTANPMSSVGDYGLFTGVFTLSNISETPTAAVPQANGIYFDTATITASVGAQVIIVDKGYNAALGLADASNLSHEFKGDVTFDTIFLAYTKSTPTGPNPTGLTLLGDGISSTIQNVTGSGVTGGSYSGTQLDLLALASTPSSLSGTWSFNQKSLVTLTKLGAGANKVSAAGNFQTLATVPDGGMTLVLLGFALSGMVLMKRQLV